MDHTSPRLIGAAGANLPFGGDTPEQTLRHALASLRRRGLSDLTVSRFYGTPCFPAGAGPDYVNAAFAATVPAGMTADQVLQMFHAVEAEFGRTRETRWGMRTLDLDLMAFGAAVLPDAATQDRWRDLPADQQRRLAPDGLILPHPRLQDRAFVLVPMADVTADWMHPRLERTVAQMLAALPVADRAEVVPLGV